MSALPIIVVCSAGVNENTPVVLLYESAPPPEAVPGGATLRLNDAPPAVVFWI